MKIKKVLIAAVCVVAFTACTNEVEKADNSGRENEPGIDVTIPEPATAEDYYYTLPKNPGNVTLPEAWSGKNVFLIYSNESNSNQYSKDDTIYNLVEDEDSNRSSAAGYKRTLNPKAVYMGDGFYRDEITFELPEELKNWRHKKNIARAASQQGGELNYYNPDLGNVTEGKKVSFWYAAGDSDYLDQTGYTFTPEEGDIYNGGEYVRKGEFTLKKVGEKCRIWVLNNNPNGIDTDTVITTEKYNQIAKVIDDCYTHVTDIFGSNAANGGTQVITADENTKLEVLVYDLFANAQYSENGGVLGFFRSLDFWQNKHLISTNRKEMAWSNECQLINIDSYFLTNKKFEGKTISTLIHEFQHLLNYCNKDEYSTWFTEMLSMCSEDVFTNEIGLTQDEGPMNRIIYGDFGKPNLGFINWGSGNNVYYSYANAYAFGAYLMRNYGGLKLIHDIATNSFSDKAAITAALQNCGYDETFDSVFQKFAITWIYTEGGANFYSFNKGFTESFNSYEYTLNAINLDEARFFIGQFNGSSLENKQDKVEEWINNNLYIKTPNGRYNYYWNGNQKDFFIETPKIYLRHYKLEEAIQSAGFAVYYLGRAGNNQTYTIDKNSNLTMTLVVK